MFGFLGSFITTGYMLTAGTHGKKQFLPSRNLIFLMSAQFTLIDISFYPKKEKSFVLYHHFVVLN